MSSTQPLLPASSWRDILVTPVERIHSYSEAAAMGSFDDIVEEWTLSQPDPGIPGSERLVASLTLELCIDVSQEGDPSASATLTARAIAPRGSRLTTPLTESVGVSTIKNAELNGQSALLAALATIPSIAPYFKHHSTELGPLIEQAEIAHALTLLQPADVAAARKKPRL